MSLNISEIMVSAPRLFMVIIKISNNYMIRLFMTGGEII